MRIVDLTSFFARSCGGIKTYYQAKARYLPELGFDCHFVVPGARTEQAAFGKGTLHTLAGPPMPFNDQYRLFARLDAVADLVRRLAPDVIELASHVFLPRAVFQALRTLPGHQPRVVGFFHSDLVSTWLEPTLRRLPARLGRWALGQAWQRVRRQHARYDATLVASRFLERKLAGHGIPRVAWVGLGVDVDTFRPARGPIASTPATSPLLVYAGRLSRDKGIDLLVRAMDRIHRATGARLRILGAGPAERAIRAFAREDRPYVQVAGYAAEPAAVASTLAEADAVITPGSHETFSLSTAEALACGTPVIAPNTGGAGELVTASRGGVLFRADDVGSLVETATSFLRAPAIVRRQVGHNGRRHMLSTFTWPLVMRRIESVYTASSDAPTLRVAVA